MATFDGNWNYDYLYPRFCDLISRRPVSVMGLLEDVGLPATQAESSANLSSPSKKNEFCRVKVLAILEMMSVKPEIKAILSSVFVESDSLDTPVKKVSKLPHDERSSRIFSERAADADVDAEEKISRTPSKTVKKDKQPAAQPNRTKGQSHTVSAGDVVGDSICQFDMDE